MSPPSDSKHLCEHKGKIGEGHNEWSCTLHPSNRCHFHTFPVVFIVVLFDNKTTMVARPPVVKVLVLHYRHPWVPHHLLENLHPLLLFLVSVWLRPQVFWSSNYQPSPLFHEGINIVLIKVGEAISNFGLAGVVIQIFSLGIKSSTVGCWGASAP